MIVDGFEVLRLHHVIPETRVVVQALGNIAHHVLDELGVVVGAFGDRLFVDPLENAVELAGAFGFGDVDKFLEPEELGGAYTDGDQRALVVGAVVRDVLGTGAERGDRHLDLDIEIGALAALVADEGDVVVHHAFFLRDRRVLVDEVGKAHLDMAVVGLETLGHLAEHAAKRLDRDLVLVRVENLHETRHVRALEVMGQVHIHAEGRDRALMAAHALLDRDRVANVADADLVDRQMTRIVAPLYILDVGAALGGAFRFD